MYTASPCLLPLCLQGVARDDGYVLTDPCIHCKDDRFGTTNFGEVGIKRFFRTHQCNQVILDTMGYHVSKINSQLQRCSTARGSNTRFSVGGPTKVKACKSLMFT